mgnify:CR=1 FL=1
MQTEDDVVVIGAGPSGAIASALLRQRGYGVTVVEQSHFPRFSIGESLLPQCMTFIEEAGMMAAVKAEDFQFKDGAAFARAGLTESFDFTDKFSEGPGTTFQVQRDRFDQVLAGCASDAGADIRFGHSIKDVSIDDDGISTLGVSVDTGESYTLRSKFLVDASGFGRVLPRLLGLDAPANFPSRRSIFTHIEDNITDPTHDRDRILIVVHPKDHDVWYWLIPFSNGRCSVGVVGPEEYFDLERYSAKELLLATINDGSELEELLAAADYDTEVRSIVGYASNVSSLWGKGFVLLGNAGEFLDPVFSSGVTIAMKSASLAAPLIDRQLSGESVNWDKEFTEPLQVGVNTFRTYVESWYKGDFQSVIFSEQGDANVRRMICSILAGYAWDTSNPFVAQAERRLNAVAQICQ